MDAREFMPDAAVVETIRRDIELYEGGRVKAMRQVNWRVPVFLGALALLTVLLAIAFNGLADPYEQWLSAPHVFLYFGAVVAGIFLYTVAMKPANELRQSFRDGLLPVIFGFIDDVRYRRGGEPDSFSSLPSEVVGSFNRQTFDDIVSGRYGGFDFELYEARLARKAGKSEQTVFKGVVMALKTEGFFQGLLVATRRTGAVTRFFRDLFGSGDSMQELSSGLPALDEAYEFKTDNAEAARPLVAGRLARALDWLREAWPHEPARVALRGSEAYLLLPHSRNFFELPGIRTPLDYGAHIEPIIADMVQLIAIGSLIRQVGAPGDEPAAPPSPPPAAAA